VVETIPGQDQANEGKQGVYLFYKNLMELEEFPLQICTKITVTGKISISNPHLPACDKPEAHVVAGQTPLLRSIQ